MTDPTDILNWRRLSDKITTSGQPSEAQLACLKALGVTNVINLALHTHERALTDEARTVADLGMAYVHIPVSFDRPDEADYRRFIEAMAAVGEARVHIHCIMNYRVSAFIYRYQQDIEGLDEVRARAVMESVWRPGGAWAHFISDTAATSLPHRSAAGQTL